MFEDQSQKSIQVQSDQAQSGGEENSPESIRADEPATACLEINTTSENIVVDDVQEAEQKKLVILDEDMHPEYDDKLKKLPVTTNGASKVELPAHGSPKQDIENQEMDPQRNGSKRKRSKEYDLVTFEDETAKESKTVDLFEVKLGSYEVKRVSYDDTPAPPLLSGVRLVNIAELLESKRAVYEEVAESELSTLDKIAEDEEIEPQKEESMRTLSTSENHEINEKKKLGNFNVEDVSDDDLPAPPVLEVFNVTETEEVSDEELPEAKHAKLPYDTELVSEDELPMSENCDQEMKSSRKKSERTCSTSEDSEIKNEVVADENLPPPPILRIPETEEVSDEELPEPKRAQLPADTEVVSEDELPVAKHQEQDSDEEEIMPQKKGSKRKLSFNEEYEMKKEGDSGRIKPKKISSSDRYWKAVNKDPTDFSAWSYLLQFVDQNNDFKAAREAYDAFLSHYPYCYGYWRRYADYEKSKGNKKKCEEVLERGLKAIPLSVDLWIYYLSYVKNTKEKDEEYIRLQFERALTACSLDFRSDQLWEFYIKWELEGKRLRKVTAIYDKLLATPTLGYTAHFDNFQEYVASNELNQILEEDEFMTVLTDIRNSIDNKENLAENADIPPGDEDSKLYTTEKESKALKERIVSIRRELYINTVNCVKARWEFEQAIKRPYFHVKPLERCQLKNWEQYLDYEIQQGDKQRIMVLFERCLIACALYEDFWLKYISFLESLRDADAQKRIRDVYERSCMIYHIKNLQLHLKWANFEEACADFSRAAEILVNFEAQVPNLLQVAYSRINLERRQGNFDKCTELFEHYIANFKNKFVSSSIAVKYSRFCLKVLEDIVKAQEVLEAAIVRDTDNPRLYLMLVDLILLKKEVREVEVLNVINQFLEKESVDLNQKTLFAQRKLQFIEDFGSDVQLVDAAREQYKNLHKLTKSSVKKDSKSESSRSLTSKNGKKESPSNLQWHSCNDDYGNSPWGNQPWYNYYGMQQGEYMDPQYGQGYQYQYQNQNWQPPQDSYYPWTSY